MIDNLQGCVALAVEVGGSRRFAGTVTEITDKVCRLTVRGDLELAKGTRLKVVFRTDAGQTSVDAQVAVSSDAKVVLVLTSSLDNFRPRSSQRRSVNQVSATCLLERVELQLHVLDISEGGFRYCCHLPLPTGQDINVTFSFDGHIAECTCQVLRQSEEPNGQWIGGAKFCPQSRVDMARLKKQIQYAA